MFTVVRMCALLYCVVGTQLECLHVDQQAAPFDEPGAVGLRHQVRLNRQAEVRVFERNRCLRLEGVDNDVEAGNTLNRPDCKLFND